MSRIHVQPGQIREWQAARLAFIVEFLSESKIAQALSPTHLIQFRNELQKLYKKRRPIARTEDKDLTVLLNSVPIPIETRRTIERLERAIGERSPDSTGYKRLSGEKDRELRSYLKGIRDKARQQIDQASEAEAMAATMLACVRIRYHLFYESSVKSGERDRTQPVSWSEAGWKFPGLAGEAQCKAKEIYNDYHIRFPVSQFPSLLDLLLYGARMRVAHSLAKRTVLGTSLAVEDLFSRRERGKERNWGTWEDRPFAYRLLNLLLEAFVSHASQETPLSIGFCWNCGKFFVHKRGGGLPARTCKDACKKSFQRYRSKQMRETKGTAPNPPKKRVTLGSRKQ